EIVATNLAGRTRVDYGYRVSSEKASYHLTELFSRQADEDELIGMSTFGEMRFDVNDRLTVISGAVLMFYPRLSAEPRFRMTWRPGFVSGGELTAAAGMYSQDLAGISDVRD